MSIANFKPLKAWDRFFFEPISPAAIGLFRICIGLVVFTAMLGIFPFRTIFYGNLAIVPPETMNAFLVSVEWMQFRWFVPYTEPGLKYYFLLLLIASVCLTIGLFTRISSILVFFMVFGLHQTNGFNLNRGDELMRINLFLLMFSQAGSAYSVDRWLRRRRGIEGAALVPSAPWAQRFIQLQLAYVYIDTVILKMQGPSWRDGTAMYYALQYLELKRFDFGFLFHYLWQVKLATWSVMLAEGAAGTLIWFRKLRYPIVAAAMGLHFGINLSMQFPTFQYVMIASLMTFIYPEDVEMAVQKWLNPALGRARSMLDRWVFRRGQAVPSP